MSSFLRLAWIVGMACLCSFAAAADDIAPEPTAPGGLLAATARKYSALPENMLRLETIAGDDAADSFRVPETASVKNKPSLDSALDLAATGAVSKSRTDLGFGHRKGLESSAAVGLRAGLETEPGQLDRILAPARAKAVASEEETASPSFNNDGLSNKPASKELTGKAAFQAIISGSQPPRDSAKSISLRQALQLAFRNNPEINAARAGLRGIGETVSQARASGLPSVFATFNAESAFSGIGGSGRFRQADRYDLGLELNQKLFDGFQTGHKVAGARAQVSAAREELLNLEQNVLYSTATVYMDVLRNREIVALRRKNMGFLDEQVRVANGLREIGEGTLTDVAQARSQRALAEALLSSAVAELETSEAMFQKMVGAAPTRLMPASLPKSLLPATIKEAQSVAQSEHPVIHATRFTADAAASNVGAAQGALLPSINLTASLNDTFAPDSVSSANGTVTGNQGQLKAAVGIKLTVPLFQGGGASSRVRQAQDVRDQRRIEVESSRARVRAAVATAWAQLKAAKANVAGFEARVASGGIALDGVLEQRSVGQRTTLDVLNANDQLITSQILLLGAQRDMIVASYAMLSSIGRLSIKKISRNIL